MKQVRDFFVSQRFTLFSIGVGCAAGLSSFLFIRSVRLIEAWLWHPIAGWSMAWSRVLLALLPAFGAGLGAWLVSRLGPGASGTGTAEVIYALRRRRGELSARETCLKAIASALTIGSGGSTGPEGPVIQIGAGVGSQIARRFGLSTSYVPTLVAAGASAGVAAVFHAPMAAVMFSLEVLGLPMASEAFAMVVLSCVVGFLVSRSLLGPHSFFTAIGFDWRAGHEIINFVVLGIASALIAKVFLRMLHWIEEKMERDHQLSLWRRAAIGGLAVGAIGIYFPFVLGSGHQIIQDMLRAPNADILWYLPFVWMFGKMIATSLTLGSGGSGGILLPALFVGAMLGEGVGFGAAKLGLTSLPPAAFALVGMAGVFAGVTHAFFTTILLLFEMTNDYGSILPLMMTVGICLLVAKAIDPHSIDSRKLLRKGVREFKDPHLVALDHLRAGDVMKSPVVSIQEQMSLPELTAFMSHYPYTGFPVITEGGQLLGLISYNELRKYYKQGALQPGVVARDLMRSNPTRAYAHEALSEVVDRMEMDGADRVLIVSEGDSSQVIGIISRTDILAAFRIG